MQVSAVTKEQHILRLLSDDESSDSADEAKLYDTRKLGRKLKDEPCCLNRRSVKRIAIPVLTVSLVFSLIVNILLFRSTSTSGARPTVCDDNSTADCLGIISSIMSKTSQDSNLNSVVTKYFEPEKTASCLTEFPEDGTASIYDNVFADLTLEEIDAVYKYLSGQADLQIVGSSKKVEGSVYGIELHVPNKTSAVDYMEGRGPKPRREARVLIKHINRTPPVVVEYVVGPLPTPSYHFRNPRHYALVPYRYHPTYGLKNAFHSLVEILGNSPELLNIMKESFNATLVDCGSNCLNIVPQKTSSAYSERTLILLYLTYKIEFPTVNPLSMIFLMRETEPGSDSFNCDSVFYGGRYFDSIESLISGYRRGKIKKVKMNFPSPAPGETSMPSTINLRGKTFPNTSQAGPKEYEPDGKRYRVKGEHIEYMEWSFNYRISTVSGPQVWDVRWSGERIAYEISLQDLGVIYGGDNPATFYTHLSDSAFGIGNKAYGLMPGVDCPEHATFQPLYVFDELENKAVTRTHAFCVFEHNTGVPLRRHNSNDDVSGKSYGGLVDRVLVVRTIIVEFNYDYIFDIIFHQNGAVEIKTYASGFLMSHSFQNGDDKFGFRVAENIVGSIHHHLFHFKIDLDIKGQINRYETLDLTLDERKWPWHKSGQETFQQLSFSHTLKATELQAVYRYNFSTPKYHIVYNNQERNKFGAHRAYRLSVEGFSKVLFPDDSPVLSSRKWCKYQIAATHRKDEEESSSSIFSMFDGQSPHVDFDRFLQDDESLVDQDLVFWVTAGFHHIPHTEDIPNTPTVGTQATISLMPYNYFPECPSVGSRDAVRADVIKDSVVFQDYGLSVNSRCLPNKFDFSYLLLNKSHLFP
ncbi:putative amine oxidase [copper-containing] [Biomphalaria glabrata]|uniref:Amine oxidase n=1 Tax=Biomphalaria glabrata TaxID=6526 RepID=A0A9W2ZTC8_BIOGL|nr:putative amine oxidase [copper-containing] [Biomphalaria glabrata]XP_055878219.1 putative amine oxidase [copper-containing] [Biomphalaria glabrata]KAI8793349.1 amine oxidase [copper-containing] [Biomphalaria glabrata]